MAEDNTQIAVENISDTARLARERLLWAIKPFGFIGLVLWILTPETVDRADISTQTLLAFFLGACYGVVIYSHQLKFYVLDRMKPGIDRRNRIPEEYYWGQVDIVMARWK